MVVTNGGLVILNGDEVDADVALAVIALFAGCGLLSARAADRREIKLELFWHWSTRGHSVDWVNRAHALRRGLGAAR